VQLARRLSDRGAFAVAIQLTDQKRCEEELATLKTKATASSRRSKWPLRHDNGGGPLVTLHQLTRRNLDTARGSLAALEAQVVAAKALVQSLENQLILVESASHLADMQRRSRDNSDNDRDKDWISAGWDIELVRCGVCLEISRTKILQCNEGTVPVPM
jgi:hypothetical protein